MSSRDWKRYKLGDLVDNSRGISYGIVQPGEFLSEGGVPILKVNNLTENKTTINDVFRVAKSVESKYERTRLRGDEILVSLVGSLGYVFKTKEEHIGWNVVRAIGVLPVKKGVNRDWIYWYLKSPEIQTAIQNNATVTVQATLNLKELREIEVPIPDENTQRTIVSILSSLEEKIELNFQANLTLESIAQSIFKEWFVNFNFPGVTGEMAESEMGMIPKGWKVVSLGEITDLTWGDTKTTKQSYIDEGFPAYSASGQDGYLPYYDFDRSGVVVSAIGAYAGKTWLVSGKWSCIKNTIRFWSIDENISNEYLYLYTQSENFWTLRGSAQPFISQTDSRNAKVIYPDNGLAKLYGEIVRVLFEQIKNNEQQSFTLAKIRDALLPKLMNGEIEI